MDGGKLSISIASVSLSSAKIHFALNLEDKGTPDDVETIGLFDIKNNDGTQIFNKENLLDLINETALRFIDELETIENDISKIILQAFIYNVFLFSFMLLPFCHVKKPI